MKFRNDLPNYCFFYSLSAHYFPHIHNSLLHYIITSVIMNFFQDSFIFLFYFQRKIFLYSNFTIYLYFHTVTCVSPSLRNSHSQMSFIVGVLKIFTLTHLCWILFLDALRPVTLLKRDSNIDVFL